MTYFRHTHTETHMTEDRKQIISYVKTALYLVVTTPAPKKRRQTGRKKK